MKITPKKYKKVYFIWLQDEGCQVKDSDTGEQIGHTYDMPPKVNCFLTNWEGVRLNESISRVTVESSHGNVNIRYKGSEYGLFYDMTKEQYFIEWC